MLEERLAFPHRVGSARSGSGSSRVGSARVAGARIGSARPSSDARRPKLHTGRPSSAPPGHSPAPPHSPGWAAGRLGGLSPHHTHDVAHLNLRVEGKSIRSVSYAPRRHQPVSRGSVRVVSSHAHATPARRRQFLSLHKAGSCDRRGNTTAAAAVHSKASMRAAAAAAAAAGFGSTYTVVCHDPEEGGAGPGHLGATFTKEASAFLGEGLGATYNLRSGQGLPPPSPSSSESDLRAFAAGECEYGVAPHSPGGGGGYWGSSRGRADPSRVPLTDTTSNEDSESTVVSLGRRIQRMAAATLPWDSEWKTLLQQNHQLLLRLSSREDLRASDDPADSPRSASLLDSALQTLAGTPSPEPALLSGSEAGSEPVALDGEASECVLEDIVEESSLSDPSSPRTIVDTRGRAASPTPCGGKDSPCGPTKPVPDHTWGSSPLHQEAQSHARQSSSLGEESVQFLCRSPSLTQDTFQGALRASPHPQGAQEPSRQALASKEEAAHYLLEPSVTPDSLQDYTTSSPPLREHTSSHPHKPSSLAHQECLELCPQQPQEAGHTHSPSPDSSRAPPAPSAPGQQDATPTLPPGPSYADSSCTADLPSYRAGAVTTFIMRSRFSGRDKPPPLRSQPSQDLLEALQMIEDEEKGASEPPERDRDLLTTGLPAAEGRKGPAVRGPPGGAREGAASLAAVQVLVEKVFLFTQDLVERWHLVEHNGSRGELLQQLAEAERQLEGLCVGEGCKADPTTAPDLHQACEQRWRRQRAEADARIQKNLELIRKLMDDKKRLTEECERLHQGTKLAERRQADRAKAAEERHAQELRGLKERLAGAEQERRERWTAQKTRTLRESAHRGLETKLKDLSVKHRDDVSLLKAQHWEALREAEERQRASQQTAQEELKRKCEEEKEEACRREREREQQRLDMEMRQSEQLSLARLEGVRRQQEKDLRALIEEHQAALSKARGEGEAGAREAVRQRDRLKEEAEDQVRSIQRKHEEELACLQEREERSRKEWREQLVQQQTEARQQAERELRERLKRQRDKEIERAIKEIQAETAAREEEQRRTSDAKIKGLRDRYEAELHEMDSGERAARTRYLEMKSLLAQKEEETVYLRARLHTQDLELCDLQQMLQPSDG